MPAQRKEETRVLPPEGSKAWPAYVIKRVGQPNRYRYVIQRPGVDPEIFEADSLAEIKVMRARSERRLVEHSLLSFERAIELYIASYVKPSLAASSVSGVANAGTIRTKTDRLLGIFGPVLGKACASLNAAGAQVLYTGKVAPKVGPDGKPVVIEPGFIHRLSKKPRLAAVPGVPADRSGRGTGLMAGRYQGVGERHQVCNQCGQKGHNRRAHRNDKTPPVPPPGPEKIFAPPSAATHQAALREAKAFMAWLLAEGFITPDKDGNHAFSNVKPFGRKPEGGFGRAKLTDEELMQLDRACIFILGNLASLPEEVRLAWQQRAVVVLLCMRAGARSGEVRLARRRQFTIMRRSCAQLGCESDHGGHVAGKLQVVRESAKTGTSVRDLPIAPSLMVHVMPLLEGKHMEHYFLAGAPRGRTGFGIGGANWERDPAVPLSKRWLANSLAKLCEIAAVRKANPHSLRGNYSDGRISSGDSFAEVSRSLGHGKTKTTERHYLNPEVMAESEQRRMMERLGYNNDGGSN